MYLGACALVCDGIRTEVCKVGPWTADSARVPVLRVFGLAGKARLPPM